MRYGVGVARKAGARTRDVLNTRPLAEVAEYLRARRERARGRLGSAGG